ncbi:DUF7533 family protein [Natrialbaceae archaeon A-gly3]
MPGIVDTVKLTGTLILAIPAALAGLEFLLARGQPAVGAVLLVLAAGLVLVQQFVPTPSDLPKHLLQRLVGSSGSERDRDEE